MSDAGGYRKDAREKRREVIAFPTSWARIAGPIVGVAITLAMLYLALFLGERKVALHCARDEHGQGTCTHVIERIAWQDDETFDVRALRGARVELGKSKSGPTYRTFVNVAGAERPLGDVNGNDEQLGVAAGIDRFARDPAARSFDDAYVPRRQFWVGTLFSMFFAAGGIVVAIGTRRLTAARRLVLDEDTNTATLERKTVIRWKKLWAVKLDSVRGARVDKDKRGFPRLVIDTKEDGALVADEASSEDTPVVAAVRRFLDRDAS